MMLDCAVATEKHSGSAFPWKPTALLDGVAKIR